MTCSLKPSLFLGCSIDAPLQKELQQADPYLSSLLIGQKDYLVEVEFNQTRFIGKYIENYPTIGQLGDLEKHILSLLQRLTSYDFVAKISLQLLMIDDARRRK